MELGLLLVAEDRLTSQVWGFFVVVSLFVISSKIYDFTNIIKVQEENIKVHKVKL